MSDRDAINAVLDAAYAARRSNDAPAAGLLFTADGHFGANGSPSARTEADRAGAMKGMFAAFEVVGFQEHCRIIDPPRAVVHWRGSFKAQNGKVGDTDVLDLIEIRDGKIASLTSFFDTAYATALTAT